MNQPQHLVSLIALGLYLPEGRETALEAAGRLDCSVDELIEIGFCRRAVPDDPETALTMAAWAADQALFKSGVEPDRIGLVVWVGGPAEVDSPAVAVALEAGCPGARALDLGGPGDPLIGLAVAKGLLAGRPELDLILLVGGYRPPAGPDSPAAAGSGGAMLIGRSGGLAELERIYWPPAGAGSGDPVEAMIEAATGLGRPEELGYLALPHLPPDRRRTLLDRLGVEPGKSVALNMWGRHHGNDPLLSLALALGADLIPSGGRVGLVNLVGPATTAVAWRWRS